MSLGMSGENIMSSFRITIILIMFLLLVVFGCSSDKTDKTSEDTSDLDTNYYSHLSPEEQEIANTLNDALQRLRYNDKSGLYELEFSYYTDENSYDEYIKRGEIQYAQMDSIHHLEVYDFIYYGEDSADVNIAYIFSSPGDSLSKVNDKFRIYKSNDRWVKPTVTRIRYQEEYDYKIQKAIEAAEEENN